ncbi:hypothetical protein CPB83DRAFT_905931 [Crepidotus variabilis]|uniref:Uncharacterized protein n=1 Tax=Crepidotus variabilis TaxID=179855 RepID=A0A9P6EH49_9AGAR|nr:hypothetical protein CPB83DRAFT_905931 [Crepidotus variabilis]
MKLSFFFLTSLALPFIGLVAAQDGSSCSGAGNYGCGARPGGNAYVWVCGSEGKGHLVAYCACPTCCRTSGASAFCT